MGNDIIFVMYYTYYNHKFIIQGSGGFRLMGSGLWWQLRCKIYICGEAATTISNFSFLIQTRFSNGIKGRPAPMATPEPRTHYLPQYFLKSQNRHAVGSSFCFISQRRAKSRARIRLDVLSNSSILFFTRSLLIGKTTHGSSASLVKYRTSLSTERPSFVSTR